MLFRIPNCAEGMGIEVGRVLQIGTGGFRDSRTVDHPAISPTHAPDTHSTTAQKKRRRLVTLEVRKSETQKYEQVWLLSPSADMGYIEGHRQWC